MDLSTETYYLLRLRIEYILVKFRCFNGCLFLCFKFV